MVRGPCSSIFAAADSQRVKRLSPKRSMTWRNRAKIASPFEVTGAAALVHPGAEAHPGSGGGGAVGPAGDPHRGGQLAGCGRQSEASGRTMCLSAGRGR